MSLGFLFKKELSIGSQIERSSHLDIMKNKLEIKEGELRKEQSSWIGFVVYILGSTGLSGRINSILSNCFNSFKEQKELQIKLKREIVVLKSQVHSQIMEIGIEKLPKGNLEEMLGDHWK